MEWIFDPWPWWLSGILIGLTVPALYILSGKAFGISSSLRHIGSFCFPRSTVEYIRENSWLNNSWNLVFVFGVILGGFIANNWLSATPVEFLPASYFSVGGAIRLFLGGVLVGFGTRYAGGCTSGHSITGIANLNWPSVVATVFFFVGGLTITWGFGWLLF
ncbi:MAG: YeeE/YedE thiosulfate transporter family protein [Chloroflexota bacterium]